MESQVNEIMTCLVPTLVRQAVVIRIPQSHVVPKENLEQKSVKARSGSGPAGNAYHKRRGHGPQPVDVWNQVAQLMRMVLAVIFVVLVGLERLLQSL